MATILIVEQQAGHRELAALLAARGHRLLEAADGERALAVARAEKPELVLVDILMPRLDGHQLVRRLRAEPVPVQPQVVFMTAAYLETAARALGYSCGVSRVIVKPAEAEALAATIHATLAGPRPPAQAPGVEPSPTGTRLQPAADQLAERLAQLEQINAELKRRAATYLGQLEVARSALEQEVEKRLWAEQELTQLNLRLRDKAVRDALTGLYNRGYLEESLNREESRARRRDQSLGIMMIDIDYFKRFNDQFGHAAGDAVLRAVGRHMLSLARGEDILCRYGGEEFVLVMADASPATVRERAERIRRGVQLLEIECDGRMLGRVTVSIGIAMYPDRDKSGLAVLQAADAALYRAKQLGRDCIVAVEDLVQS